MRTGTQRSDLPAVSVNSGSIVMSFAPLSRALQIQYQSRLPIVAEAGFDPQAIIVPEFCRSSAAWMGTDNMKNRMYMPAWSPPSPKCVMPLFWRKRLAPSAFPSGPGTQLAMWNGAPFSALAVLPAPVHMPTLRGPSFLKAAWNFSAISSNASSHDISSQLSLPRSPVCSIGRSSLCSP